jgi:hypothetical protein
MTGDIYQYVWRGAPLGKYLVGRRKVDQLTEMAIGAWEDPPNKDRLVASVNRIHEATEGETHGTVWVILLQFLASAIIQLLIEWWFKSQQHRLRLLVMQQEVMR